MSARKLILVDGSNHAFRLFHVMGNMSAGGFPTGALYGFATLLRQIERSEKPDFMVVVFDRGKSFRVALYPDYKGHRPEMPPELAKQWPEFQPLVEAWGYRCLAIEGYEADDIIGTLARRFSGPDMDVFIASGDKDFAQLVDAHTFLLDLHAGARVVMGSGEVAEKFGVPPERIIDMLALWGDASDNVPGVPKVGEKRARALIQQFGGLDDVLAHAAELKGKEGENLVTYADQARLCRQLVTIVTDMDLPLTLDDLAAHRRDEEGLRSLFRRYQFRSLLTELPPAPALAVSTARPVQVTILRDKKDVASAVDRCLRQKSVCLDVLRAGDDPRGSVIGLGLCADPAAAFSIPLGIGGVSLDSIRAPLQDLLGDAGHPKSGHDLKSCLHFLLDAGFRVDGVAHDVLIADALLEPDRENRSLALLAESVIDERLELQAPAQASLFPREDGGAELAGLRARASLLIREAQAGLLEKAGMTGLFVDIEMPVLPVLVDMERHGIRLDPKALERLGQDLATRIAEQETRIFAMVGHDFNINSPKQLAEVLFDERGLTSTRKTRTGRSTDADTLEALAAHDPLPAAVLEYRSLSKLKGTYVDALPTWVHPNDGRVHTTYLQTVAATGRLSSVDPNLQNIPIRSAEGRLIRACFVPDPGFLFVSADYSQVELRILADRCGEGPLLQAFLKGEDIHRSTAAEVFGVAPALVTPDQRRAAKAINFGIIYGMGAFRLANDLGIPRREAQRIIDAYLARYPQVKAYVDDAIAQARRTGFATTRFGRRRPLPDIHAAARQLREAAERMAVNTPIQGTAAELMKIAMVRVWKRLREEFPRARLLLQVHDELVLEAPRTDVETLRSLLEEEMGAVAELKVPLTVGTAAGENWEEAH